MRPSHHTPAFPEPAHDTHGLIDVSFLLLIYFLVTATLMLPEVDVDMKLGNPSEPASPSRPLVVEIGRDGEILAGSPQNMDPVGRVNAKGHLPILRQRLKRLCDFSTATGEAPAVVVRANDEASHASFVATLDTIRSAGIANIAIAQ